MPKKLLFIEDSALVLKVMKRLIQEENAFQADFAETFAEAKAFIGDEPEKYFAAVADLNLPDAPKGEVVDLVLGFKIPTLVLTATFDEAKKDELFKKGIVDYVVKENRYSYDYAVKLMVRLCRNRAIKVMVVDDSLVARKQVSKLLRKYLFKVVEVEGAKTAIRALVDQPDIKMVVTDYHMPDIDGFELVKLIRGKYGKHDLTIIGLSGEGDASLSAKFIKNGANDFLRKPFNQEEFYCRIMHNIESLEAIEQIRDAANRDYLTSLYNRQHFYKLVEEKISDCHKNSFHYALAIVEIDDFREFNNVFSEYGDSVLIKFAEQLAIQFKGFITARLNGSQLVVFMWGMSLDDCQYYMNDFRAEIKNISIDTHDGEHFLSVSIGLSYSDADCLRTMLEHCDELINRAQDAGQDIVLVD
jgi:diguanylate cyclase (GGDEF)-like protein